MLSAVALGATAATFKELTTIDLLNEHGGTSTVSVSRNGRFVFGATYADATRYVYDTETDEMILFDGTFRASGILGSAAVYPSVVTSSGKCPGYSTRGSVIIDILNKTYTLLDNSAAATMRSVSPVAASDDASVIGGVASANITNSVPVVWINGKLSYLPYPTLSSNLGFKVNGCRVVDVSADGSVIVGQFEAYPNTYPMIIWERGEDGFFEFVDVWTDFYEPKHRLEYDYDKGEYELVKGPNPWCIFMPAYISSDGSIISMYVADNYSDRTVPYNQLAYFHVKERTLEVVPWNPNNLFGQAGGTFEILGMADDGTVVGYTGDLYTTVPFIKDPDKDPQFINDMFPNMARLQEYQADHEEYDTPYFCRGISADGRIIGGYCMSIYDYYWEDIGTTAPEFCYYSFFIDRYAEDPNAPDVPDDPSDAVEAITTDEDANPADLEYFDLQGRRVHNPGPGIYIQGGKKVVLQ